MAQRKAPVSAEDFLKSGVIVKYGCNKFSAHKEPEVVDKASLVNSDGSLNLSSLCGSKKRFPTKQAVRG